MSMHSPVILPAPSPDEKALHYPLMLSRETNIQESPCDIVILQFPEACSPQSSSCFSTAEMQAWDGEKGGATRPLWPPEPSLGLTPAII